MGKTRFIPIAAFCLYFGKTFWSPASPCDVAILLILASLSAYFCFRSETKETILENRIKDLEIKFQEKTKDIDGLKSSVTTLSVGRAVGMMNGR